MSNTYDFQLNNTADETSLIVDLNGVTALTVSTYTAASLADGLYYWRYRKHTTSGVSPWAPWRSLNILQLPATPVLVSPSNNGYDADTTPAFNWNDAARATTYDFQLTLAADTGFATPIVNTTGLSTSDYTYAGSPLSDAAYIWRARGVNGSGAGSWATAFTHNVLQVPAAPVISTPSNGAYTTDDTPTVDWPDVATATTYQIQFDNDIAFGSPALNDSTLTVSNYTATSLADDNYYIRVRAINGSGNSTWSSSVLLHILQLPATPTISAPTTGSYTADTTPDVDWADAARATTYQIQFDDDVAFGSPALDDNTLTVSNYTATTLADGNYYIRVRGINGSGNGAWSTSVLLHILQLPATPVLLTPLDNYWLSDTTPTHDWLDAARASTYDFQLTLSSDTGFAAPIENVTALAVSTYTLTTPLALGTYLWRARGVNGTGNGAWATAYTLHIANPLLDHLAALASNRYTFGLDEAAGIYALALNPTITIGRDVVINGAFASALTPWTGTNWAQTGGVARHTAGATANLTQTSLTTIGKAYRLTYDILNRTAGQLVDSGGGTRTTNASFSIDFIATQTSLQFTPNSAFDGDLDNVVLKEINIRPSTDYPRLNIATNFGLDFSYGWTGTNWAISAGKLVHSTGSTVNAAQTGASTVIGKSYDITITVSGRTAGSVTPKIGTTGSGTARSTNATFTETIVAAGTAGIYFTPTTDFDGSIDDILVVPTDSLLLWGGNMELAGVAEWAAVTAGTISKETASPAPNSGTQWLKIARNASNDPTYAQAVLVVGRRYRVQIAYVSDGNAVPRVLDTAVVLFTGGTGTSFSTTDFQFTATTTSLRLQAQTSTGAQWVGFDTFILTEINPITGIVNGATVNQSSGGLLLQGYSFDATNDWVDQYSSTLNSVESFNVGRHKLAFSVRNTGVLSDGLARTLFRRRADANNSFLLRKDTVTNQFSVLQLFGGTTKTLSFTISDANKHVVDIVWDITAGGTGTIFVYLDGTQVGTDTGLGTWAGNLGSTASLFAGLGDTNNAGGSPWDGFIWLHGHYNDYASAATILAEAQLAGVA